MILINIVLISLIWVFILDISGFWNEITSMITSWMTKGAVKKPFTMKPFSCSLCMTFWTSLIYVICINHFTLPIVAFICLMAYMTGVEQQVILTIEALIMKLIEWIQEKVK